MGLGGISMWQLLIILLIVVMIFGTKRLASLGSDLGGAVKGFRKAMGEVQDDDEDDPKQIKDEKDADFGSAQTRDASASESKTKS